MQEDKFDEENTQKQQTFKLILIIPVTIDAFENSTELNISMRSENKRWIFDTKLFSNCDGV